MDEDQRVRAVTDAIMGTKTFKNGDRVILSGFASGGHPDFAHLEGVPGTVTIPAGLTAPHIKTDWPVQRWRRNRYGNGFFHLESEVQHSEVYLFHYGDDYDDATLQEVRRRSTGG